MFEIWCLGFDVRKDRPSFKMQHLFEFANSDHGKYGDVFWIPAVAPTRTIARNGAIIRIIRIKDRARHLVGLSGLGQSAVGPINLCESFWPLSEQRLTRPTASSEACAAHIRCPNGAVTMQPKATPSGEDIAPTGAAGMVSCPHTPTGWRSIARGGSRPW